jgi:predicted nucleotidyltransferase
MMEDSEKRIGEALAQLKNRLQELLKDSLVRLVLFGSRARGDYEEFSDVDVALIVRGLTRELKDRILREVADIELEHCQPLSVLVLSEEEFNRLRERERRIARDILEEGVPL